MPIKKSTLRYKLALGSSSDADIAKVKNAMNNFSSFDFDTIKYAYRNVFKKDPTISEVSVISDKILESSTWLLVHNGSKFRNKDIPYVIAERATRELKKILETYYRITVTDYSFWYEISTPHFSDAVRCTFKLQPSKSDVERLSGRGILPSDLSDYLQDRFSKLYVNLVDLSVPNTLSVRILTS